jgi:hypothetical protein
MRWGPTLLVLAVFGVLLYVSWHKPQDAAARAGGSTAATHAAPAAAAPQGTAPASSTQGSSLATALHGNEPAAPQEPAKGTHPSAPAPAVGAPTAKSNEEPAAEGPAVEPVKNAAAAPPPRTPNSIAGVVKDPAGVGVAQILVRLATADGKEVGVTRSDAGGRFAFQDVAPGSYALSTYDPDYLYTARAETKVTAKKDAVNDAEIRVTRGTAGVRGTLVDGAGKPIPDKRVALTAGSSEISVMTDAKGRFQVNGLVAGDWRVIPDGAARAGKSVKVAAGSTAEVGLVLARSATIEMQVVGSMLHPAEFHEGDHALLRKAGSNDAPVSVPLALEEKKEEHDPHAPPETIGIAKFADLAPGDYELDVSDAAGAKSLLHLGAPWSTPTAVTLREGEVRPLVLPTMLASLGRGAEVPTWIRVIMFLGIGALVFATPVLFPPPLVPKRPAAKAGASAAH